MWVRLRAIVLTLVLHLINLKVCPDHVKPRLELPPTVAPTLGMPIRTSA